MTAQHSHTLMRSEILFYILIPVNEILQSILTNYNIHNFELLLVSRVGILSSHRTPIPPTDDSIHLNPNGEASRARWISSLGYSDAALMKVKAHPPPPAPVSLVSAPNCLVMRQISSSDSCDTPNVRNKP